MTHAVNTQTTARVSDTARHWTTAIVTVVGVVAAAIGAWLAYGPADATISFLGWTQNVADIDALWAPWLMIAGGLLASISMAWEAARTDEDHPGLVVMESLLVMTGITAAIIGIILLF